jgi:hypothetical protein
MVKAKRTTDSTALNPFRASVVKLISARLDYNAEGRCVLVRTFETVDGKRHISKEQIDSELVLNTFENLLKSFNISE